MADLFMNICQQYLCIAKCLGRLLDFRGTQKHKPSHQKHDHAYDSSILPDSRTIRKFFKHLNPFSFKLLRTNHIILKYTIMLQ